MARENPDLPGLPLEVREKLRRRRGDETQTSSPDDPEKSESPHVVSSSLAAREKEIHERGLVSVRKPIHNDLDDAATEKSKARKGRGETRLDEVTCRTGQRRSPRVERIRLHHHRRRTLKEFQTREPGTHFGNPGHPRRPRQSPRDGRWTVSVCLTHERIVALSGRRVCGHRVSPGRGGAFSTGILGGSQTTGTKQKWWHCVRVLSPLRGLGDFERVRPAMNRWAIVGRP